MRIAQEPKVNVLLSLPGQRLEVLMSQATSITTALPPRRFWCLPGSSSTTLLSQTSLTKSPLFLECFSGSMFSAEHGHQGAGLR